MADGDIELRSRVELDTRDALEAAKKLSRDVEKALNFETKDSGLKETQKDLKQINSQIIDVSGKLKDLDKQVPTAAWKKVSDQIDYANSRVEYYTKLVNAPGHKKSSEENLQYWKAQASTYLGLQRSLESRGKSTQLGFETKEAGELYNQLRALTAQADGYAGIINDRIDAQQREAEEAARQKQILEDNKRTLEEFQGIAEEVAQETQNGEKSWRDLGITIDEARKKVGQYEKAVYASPNPTDRAKENLEYWQNILRELQIEADKKASETAGHTAEDFAKRTEGIHFTDTASNTQSVEDFKYSVEQLKEEYDSLNEAVTKFSSVTDRLSTATSKEEIDGLTAELHELEQEYGKVGRLDTDLTTFKESLTDVKTQFDNMSASGELSVNETLSLTEQIQKLENSYYELQRNMQPVLDTYSSMNASAGSTEGSLASLAQQIAHTEELIQTLKTNLATQREAMAPLGGMNMEEVRNAESIIASYEAKLEQLKTQYAALGGVIDETNESIVDNTEKATDETDDVWNETIRRLRRELEHLNNEKIKLSVEGFEQGYEQYDIITTRIDEIKAKLKEWDAYQKDLGSDAQTIAEAYITAPEYIQEAARRLDELYAKQDSGAKLNFGERFEVGALERQLNRYDAELEREAQAEREAASAVKANTSAKKAGVPAVEKLTKAHKNLDKATNNLKKSMHKGLVFISKYFLGFRSLFFLVRKLRTSVKEGLQNLVQFKGGANATNEAVTELQTSLLFVKNAWGAAFAPIINYVMPALTALIDLVAEAGNAIARFFATLTGQSTVIQAVKAKTGSYADTLNGAAGSAGKAADATDKLNDRLAAFDDLNVLGVDKDDGGKGTGGSGGGKGDNLPSVDEMFTEITPTSSFADMVKEAFLSGDFTAIGQAASQKIKESLENIDWEGIKEVAGRIGTGLATLINGFTADKGTFEAVGSTIAETLNTVFTAINNFVGNTNWEQVGTGLMATINSFFATTDWGLIGEDVSNSISGLMDFLSGVITEFDASKIINALYNFFAGIDYKKVFNSTGNLLASVLEGVYNLIDACMDPVAEWIVETFSNDGEFTFGAFLTGIKNSVKGIASWVQTNVFEPFIAGFCEKFGLTGDSGVGALFVRGADLIAGFLSGMIDKLKNIGSWIKEHIFDPVINKIKDLFGIHSPSTVMSEIGGFLIEGFKSGVQKGFGAVRRVFNGLKNLILGIFDTIKDKIEKVWGKIYDAVAPIINGLFGVVASVYDAVRSAVNFIIDAINTLEWDIPDWVPFVGGKSFGFDIPPLPEIDLPELASGAVIPPNREFLAVLGDQKQGTNIEAPLDTIVDAFRQVVGNLNVQNTGNQVLQVDGQTFARLMTPYVVSELGRRGYNVKLLEG